MDTAEQYIIELQKDTKRLQFEKTDNKKFLKVKKSLECADLENEIKLFKSINHCITLDNYLEKYLPIRTQGLINETLRSVLGGKERRRLELYDNEKNSILYQYLLVDDGQGNVSEIMRDLHEKASLEIEEEDRRKKHRLAITEASLSKDEIPGGQASLVGSIRPIPGFNHEHSMSADPMARQGGSNMDPVSPGIIEGT